MTAGLKLMDMTREAPRVAPVPMSHRELWTFAEERGLTTKLQAVGKTPWDSMSALIYVDTKENASSDYLVAASWLDDEEFSDELARLCQAFRIGAIHLSLEEWGASRIIHRAQVRDELDWVTLDKLVAMNPDVAQFLESVRIDLNASKIHEGEYDPPLTDWRLTSRASLGRPQRMAERQRSDEAVRRPRSKTWVGDGGIGARHVGADVHGGGRCDGDQVPIC